jgi:hypothetical protein
MPLKAYDVDGNVVATLDYLVTRTPEGKRQVDFAGHAAAGRKLRNIWNVAGAVRSAVVNAQDQRE